MSVGSDASRNSNAGGGVGSVARGDAPREDFEGCLLSVRALLVSQQAGFMETKRIEQEKLTAANKDLEEQTKVRAPALFHQLPPPCYASQVHGFYRAQPRAKATQSSWSVR